MPKIWTALAAVVVALGLAGLPPSFAQSAPQPNPDDRILGKADAPVTIFEYASLTCPHCADFDENMLPKLKAEWIDTGKARLIFRDFPLDQAAVRAAILARCAPADQFYAFIDVLFRGQTNWAVGGKVDASLGKIAKLAAEQQYKVESTPTFFINGVRVVGVKPYPEFEKILDQASKS
jgi:protein-disulfide isomerase